MKYFEIYRSAGKPLAACKIGWSWPGFAFTVVWALINRHFVMLGLGLVTAVMVYPLHTYGYVMWAMAMMALFGLEANHLKRRQLLNSGYIHVATIGAKSPDEAIVRFQSSADAGEND